MKDKNKNTPIIVANTHWDLPENLIKDIQKERMLNALIDMCSPLSPEESVGWAECIGYLMPSTQESTLRSQETEIYLYCVTQYAKGKNIEVPKECRVETLNDYQMDRLKQFKLWIYEQRGGKEKNPVINALREVFLEENK